MRLLNTDAAHEKMIAGMIRAAREYTERLCSLAMLTQTWTFTLDAFSKREIVLPRWPVISVSSITYYDTANASQTFSSASYRLGVRPDDMGIIQLNQDASWPSTYDRTGAVTVTFVAGFGATPATVPNDLVYSVKILAAEFFQNPTMTVTGTIVAGLPLSYDALTASYCRSFI